MDIEGLIRELEPLDASEPAFTSAKAKAYFRFYGLDFEDRYDDVTHYFGTFWSGGEEIVCHYFRRRQPRGTCFIFHGYFDHAGLYDHAVEYALSRGYAAVIYDLPGHGLSTGDRADIGHFNAYTAVLRDALALFEPTAPRPWVAIGQSTGGAVLMDHLLTDRQTPFEQVVLLAPLLRTVGWHWIRLSYWLFRGVLKRTPRNFKPGTSDPAFNEFLMTQDPLQERFIPVRWVGAMLDWERRFGHFPVSDFEPLIIQGQADNTVDAFYNPPAIKARFPRARILRLNQAGHQLVNERVDIREQVWAGIDQFLRSVPVEQP